MSDQQPPTGGFPDDDRPAPLIPSRAARHQAKRGLLRGRSNRPPRPAPETPERPPPVRTTSAGPSMRRSASESGASSAISSGVKVIVVCAPCSSWISSAPHLEQ